MKKAKKFLLGRVSVVALAMIAQLLWVYLTIYRFSLKYSIVDFIIQALAIITVLYIINQWYNPAYKIVWTFFTLLFPIGGVTVYFIFGRAKITKKTREKMESKHVLLAKYLHENKEIQKEMNEKEADIFNQSRYITNWSDYPAYKNTLTDYYPCGEEMFASMLKDLEQAKHFIFIEYFIVEDGFMFQEIMKIIEKKVKEGVEVRFIYDDFGCITRLPHKFYIEMQKIGVKCVVFNRMLPVLSIVMNNRDHRKILVVDGTIGYTGGMNIADEYINKKVRFGYWKDTGVRLEGEGVWNLTAMFLEMWSYINDSVEDYSLFHPNKYQKGPFITDGYVQPYGDSPLNSEKVGRNIYMNMIGHAKEYIYIFTPYLILDNEMLTYLRNAAKCGVDVRIATPGIPDKKMIFLMTQSYYQRLMESGVRIYQYKPGFLHAKSFVCDDKVATVGSINMDYRSLYLHYECGVFMYQSKAVLKVKEDSLKTFAVSKEITMEFCKKQPIVMRMIWGVLRLIAPLV